MKLLNLKISHHVDEKIIYVMGYLATCFIFFQSHFAFGKFEININIADVLAICGGITLLFDYKKINQPNLRLPHIKTFIVLAISAFIFSFVVGVFKFGFSNFAFFNKLLGLFLLLGYASLGIIYINISGQNGLFNAVRLMATVLACIIAFQIIINYLVIVRLLPIDFYHYSLNGYASNRNAFAIQLLCVIAIMLAMNSHKEQPKLDQNHWLMSFLLTGLLLTFSRSAQITAAAILLFCLATKTISFRQLIKISIQVALYTLAISAIEFCLEYLLKLIYLLQHSDANITHFKSLISDHYSLANSNNQRLYTLQEGFKLWQESPWFGIGLGGFVNHELAKNNLFLVIHSSYLWFLTEFGILGASVFFGYAAIICQYLYRLFKRTPFYNWELESQIIFYLILIFSMMAGAHEIFYQRIFWFIMGMVVIVSHKFNTKTDYL